jgi:predicted methyltransferase
MRSLPLLVLLAASCFAAPALTGQPWVVAAHADEALDQALHNPMRSAPFIARDAVRHPAEVLSFFGLRPNATVVEIWPGGGYWTEILAPYLMGYGSYIVAVPNSPKPLAAFQARAAANRHLFDRIDVTQLGPDHTEFAPPETADFVLTFRNVHNWMKGGYADDMFAAFYRVLKPGGILGLEEHRGRTDTPQDPKAENGYVRQDYTIELARKAGFVLEASSEVNANPRDTKDYPQGVWSLPPTYAEGDKNRAKYAAIGEADNFLLKFRKPAR